MQNFRLWAFWRRLQYGFGYFTFFGLVITGGYFMFFYAAPTCFDAMQNSTELAVDCGGGCTRICAFTVASPKVVWAQSFEVLKGQYNAVAYVENTNLGAGTPEMGYIFRLYDKDGLITERTGKTVLPPGSTYPIFEGRIDTLGRVPTETKLELSAPDLWLPSNLGREQFKTNDIKLVEADIRPKLNVRMENTELTEAKGVEIVATIFDAHGTALTASQTFVDLFPARSQKDIVFTWPRPIAKTLRSCAVPTDIVVVIDLSGSMNNDGANPPEPISSVLTAASAFVGNIRPDDRVAVVTFATTASTPLLLSGNATATTLAIKKLVINPKEESGSTNTGAGIAAAHAELQSDRHNKDARKVVVLLTDGLATAPGTDPNKYAETNAGLLKADDIALYTIGLGTTVNMDFLRILATQPTTAFAAPTTATLDSIYQTITAAICEEGVARIDVISKTSGNFAPLQ